uniref:Type I interferon 12 n=1 Tax=Xenopus tropicalis TaxID=8364 RepID=A0A1B1FFP3_XENTR|nr:type I interferon 12 [Xenopus tropicalis]
MAQSLSLSLLIVSVLPSSGTFPECLKLGFMVQEVQTIFGRMEPMEEIPHDCILTLPPIGFTHNMSLGAAAAVMDKVFSETIRLYRKKCRQLGGTRKDCSELLHLLHQLRHRVAPCLTDTGEYKEVMELILEHFKQQRWMARNRGNAACARHIIWMANAQNYRQVARLTSLMIKQRLMN